MEQTINMTISYSHLTNELNFSIPPVRIESLCGACKACAHAPADELADKMTPLFYEGEHARAFLSDIKGVSYKLIPSIVRRYVRERRLREDRAGKQIWRILNDAGIYPRKYANWNKQS